VKGCSEEDFLLGWYDVTVCAIKDMLRTNDELLGKLDDELNGSPPESYRDGSSELLIFALFLVTASFLLRKHTPLSLLDKQTLDRFHDIVASLVSLTTSGFTPHEVKVLATLRYKVYYPRFEALSKAIREGLQSEVKGQAPNRPEFRQAAVELVDTFRKFSIGVDPTKLDGLDALPSFSAWTMAPFLLDSITALWGGLTKTIPPPV